MNQEDKKRFARYRKGFISSKEDDDLLFLNIKNNQIYFWFKLKVKSNKFSSKKGNLPSIP